MATLLHSESRRLYSWWWDSHISPKNSKWLQENLTDMDVKVKAMIKLIEEDADSFAKRAEMYYKKRPELMKLVEEFYRAYRALAERYDHATGELRQAHRTMAEAFPNHVPFVSAEDSPSKSSEPHTPELPHPSHAFLESDDLKKQLHEARDSFTQKSASAEATATKALSEEYEEKEKILRDELSKLSNENHDLKDKVLSESKRAGEAKNQVQDLEEALANIRSEKNSVLLQHLQCLDRLSDLEREFSHAQEDSMRLNEKASRAESDVQTLKEALTNLETEKEASITKHEESLRRMYYLEVIAAQAQENAIGLSERAVKAENESHHLKLEISRLESEKDAGLHQYNLCLKKICDLENKISVAEENASFFKEQADRAEIDVRKLREALATLHEENEALTLQYNCCLKNVAKLEEELHCAREDVQRLNTEVLVGAAKLENAEEKCVFLEMSNQSLHQEADNLARRISMKDQELSGKQEELEELQVRVQDERLRHAHIEATLLTLQNLHAQSQEQQRALAVELKNGLQMLKDLESCKHGLEDELRQVRDENHCLNEQKLSSTIITENLQNDIRNLKEIKERLEEEVSQQVGRSNSLQQEIFSLREEIKGLTSIYQSLVEQVESVGLKPEQLGSSIRSLQDENSKLREFYEISSHEKDALCKKMENMGELVQKNALLERSFSAVNIELEGTREKMRTLQESCQSLNEGKSCLVAEKAAVLSQLQILTENMQKLLEKNAVLENALSGAKVELEGLREKSKCLEGICQLLKSEKINLLAERSTLVIQLENVERQLEYLEKRFTGLEEKYAGLEKDKEATHSQVDELRFSLALEKQERTSFSLQNESRFTTLDNHIHLLQEENKWRKKEFEEELDKAEKAKFEIYVLQKFIKDMEEKNYSLLIEYQKHVEASKLAEKLISELESENLEQQMEAELLLDEIEKLRLEIYHIFQALETGPVPVSKYKVEDDQFFVHCIEENIKDMRCRLSVSEDSRQQLHVENSVLLALIRQMKSDSTEVESQKASLEQEFGKMMEKLLMVQNDKLELLEINSQLKLDLSKGNQQAFLLQSELETLSGKKGDLQEAYDELQKQYSQVLEENVSLLTKFSSIVEDKGLLEQENDVLLRETLALLNLSTVLKSYGNEMTTGLNLLTEDLHNLQGVNIDLKTEISLLSERLEMKEAENLFLKGTVEKLEMELNGTKETNNQLWHEVSCGKDILRQWEAQLLEVEGKLESAESLNLELCKTVDELQTECQESAQMREKMEKQIMELSEHNISQNKEIELLCELNRNLVSEVGILREDIQGKIIREEDSSSKLEEKNNECELWEAEAATFYFDLQISSICEVLYENKVHELTEVCENLEDESVSKTVEIQQMKENVRSLESEVEGLKSQLDAYGPIVASLGDDVASLELNVLHQMKNDVAEYSNNLCPQGIVPPHGSGSEEVIKGQPQSPNGIQDLQRLQTRIKAVDSVFVQEMKRRVSWEATNSRKLVPEAAPNEIEELTYYNLDQRISKHKGKNGLEKDKSQKSRLRASDGIQMKDIPLDRVSSKSKYRICSSRLEAGGSDDQMLELWETSEDSVLDQTANIGKPIEVKRVYDQFNNVKRRSRRPSAELGMEELGVDKLTISVSPRRPNQETNSRKILERLASDADKLAGLQMNVQSLRKKVDTNKKRRKSKDIDFETVKEQLQEVEDKVAQLVELNGQLMQKAEEGPPLSAGRASGELKESIRLKKIAEQAGKSSEKIGRLQLEVQKIQYGLLKLDDEKKSKVRSRFSRSKTTIILRDFIYSSRRRGSGKRKKPHLCGCFNPSSPSTSRDGHRVSCS